MSEVLNQQLQRDLELLRAARGADETRGGDA